MAGSDPRYSFHHTGISDRLYVFEAPIDLMSFNTLYQKDWQRHSYVSLCGTGSQAMLWMLEQNPGIRRVALCMDNDSAGIKASERLVKMLLEKSSCEVVELLPNYKDWNETLQTLSGHPAHTQEPESAAVTMQMR